MKLVAAFAALLFSLGAVAAPSIEDLQAIQSSFAREGMREASIEMTSDGRLRLTGGYRDRAEVQLAFHLAQQVVGVRWVAPTTPENVRYPNTQAIKAGIMSALKRSRPVSTSGDSPGEIYGLVVGVGKYAAREIRPIPNAPDDAKAFYEFVRAKRAKHENISLLVNEQATKSNVSAAMAMLRQRVRPNDSVILFFSTHGNKPNDLGNTAVVLYDSMVNRQRQWLDPATALQDDEIKAFVEAVSPARVMVVLDVCYSGAAFAKIPGFLASSSKDLFVEEETFNTGMAQKNLTYLAGAKLEQEKILIAASGPNERSWNSMKLQHGYFTYYFLEELKRRPDVQSAFVAAKPVVQSEVQRLVSAEQNETVTQTPQATFIPEAANLQF